MSSSLYIVEETTQGTIHQRQTKYKIDTSYPFSPEILFRPNLNFTQMIFLLNPFFTQLWRLCHNPGIPIYHGQPIKDDYVLETTPSDLIFIDTSAPSLDDLFLETTPASDTFFRTTPESDYLYIDTSPPSGKFSDHIINITLVISYVT